MSKPHQPFPDDLLERDAETSRLGSVLAAAEAGRGSLAVIEGEAGIGKSRLLGAARAQAARRGSEVLGAEASELESAFPFGIALQLLAPAVARRSTEERKRLMTGAAAHARPLLEETAIGGADPDFASLDGLYWVLAALTRERPVLLAVDDLQWADAPSLRFLLFLLRRLDGVRVAVTVTRRAGEGGELVERIAREPGALVLRPRPLSPRGTAAMVERRLGTDAEPAFTATCHDVTGGNPLYLFALLAELAEAGTPPRDGSVSALLEAGPADVAHSVARRLASETPAAAAVAEGLSVLGDGSALATVARLAGLTEPEARRGADALVRLAIVGDSEPLRFAHPIVRAAVYGRMSAPERGARHSRAARQLRAAAAPPQEVAAQVERASPGTVEEALAVLEDAAGAARIRGAPEVAARLLARALREPLAGDDRVRVRIGLGTAQARAGIPEAVITLSAVLDEAPQTPARVAAATALSRTLVAAGRTRELVPLLEREIAALEPVDLAAARGLELELLAAVDVDVSARPLVRERLARVDTDPVPEDGPLATARSAHRAVALTLDARDAREAHGWAQRALADGDLLAEATRGSQYALLTMYVLTLSDHYAEAHAGFTTAMDRAQDDGSALSWVVASAQRAHASARRGALAEAEADARAGVAAAVLNGWEPPTRMALAVLGEAMVDRDPAGALEEMARSGMAEREPNRSAQDCVLLASRGVARLACGDTGRGVEDVLTAGRSLQEWGLDNPAAVPWRSAASLGLAALGEQGRARELASDQVVLAHRWGAPRALGISLRAAGLVRGGADGIELLREAVAVLETSQAELEHARSLTDLGAALRRRGHRAEAREPLRRGLELARRCGADVLVHRAHTELWATGARPRAPLRTGVDALTPSERRVAGMAADGRSNPAIAQALFVTLKTVESHLTRAYRKLDVRTREELGAALGDAESTPGKEPELRAPSS